MIKFTYNMFKSAHTSRNRSVTSTHFGVGSTILSISRVYKMLSSSARKLSNAVGSMLTRISASPEKIGFVTKLCSNACKNMFETVKNMLCVQQKYVKQLSKICLIFVKNMFANCQEYVTSMSKICYKNMFNFYI